jgi:pimeloyl-ACP methyl ester carboxylesterase
MGYNDLQIYLVSLALLLGCLTASDPALAQLATHPESGTIDADGGSVYYEAAGEGPALIMIHDGLLHSATWDEQFNSFSSSYRVIRWDRRGYGKSESPKKPFSHLDDLRALMDHLGIEEATLMGCSSGGLLAIDFTLEHPKRVSALVLVGPIISGFSFSKHFSNRGERGIPAQNAPVETKIQYWSWKDPWITAPESTAAKKRMEKLLTENPQNLVGSGRFARSPGRPALSLLSDIKIPTLLVVGESDIPDVHAHVGAIEAGIPGSQRIVIPRSGHLVHFEKPKEFNHSVSEFLTSLP